MKKLLLTLLFFGTTFSLKSQEINKDLIKEYEGIEIVGISKVRKVKEGKTEYAVTVTYQNTTEKEIFFKKNSKSKFFASVELKGLSSYVYPLSGSKTKKKIGNQDIIVLYPGEKYETYIYYPWYSNPEKPEFIFKVNESATLENDYTKYN